MVLFPKALFLVTNFPKIIKNLNFSIEFSSKIFNILSKFPHNLRFSSKREKSNAGFVKFFEKYAKLMHFRNFLKQFFEIFRTFSQNFKQIVVCVQTREKLTHALLNFLKNMLK